MATAKSKTPAAKPAEAASQEEVLVILIAKVAIEHDGKPVAPGEQFAVSPDAAKQLLDVGAAEVADLPESAAE